MYDPDCQTESRVYVNGTRIPAANVDVEIRDEGPLAVTRYAEVEFASPFNDTDYLELFETTNPDQQSKFDILRVDILSPHMKTDESTDDPYVTEFYGIVTGVGNADNSRMWNVRGKSPGHFIDTLFVSKSFNKGATDKDVTSFIDDKVESNLPVDVNTFARDVEIVKGPPKPEGAWGIVL